MNHLYTFINVVLVFLLAITLLQVVPTLISSSNNFEFYTGIGMALLGLAFIWARGIEIYKDLTKGKE
jgi:hypothetical protein